METNEFIAKLKANGSEKDWFDLTKCIDRYKEIIESLSAKDKGLFSLNVLCILIRNLDTVPSWTHKISTKELLALSIECVRQTRSLDKPEQVKTLGCVFRLHKHAITMNSSTPQELVLKLSFMAFEYDDASLLQEYYKTYGHIIIDRITYIGKLKPTKLPILKLLPKLAEDITKTIKIYDTVHFCTNMLTFVVKKLCYIYSESPKEINELLGKIFDCISKNDLKGCKNLSEKDAFDLYVKLNECLITITENSLKINFHNSVLDSMTRVCVSLLGHIPDMFHCFQTIFLNSFCCIFNDRTNPILIDNLLKNAQTSCEMTEKLGYKTIIYATYPFIGQLLRLYIEHNVNIVDKIDRSDYLNEPIQENCLKLVKFLIEKLKNTKQLTKCDNCTVKTGLHDALRLSFTVKHLITVSTNKGIELKNNLLVYFTIVEQQYLILEELNTLRCPNQERCFRKLQIDVHNIAVLLNKYKYYEYSIKLFEIYLKYELKHLKNDAELKNVSRALYNKSICELDAKLYKDSLLNAYLSLVFSLPEGLKSEKYMSLVIDVKAKALKSVTEDVSDEINELQSMSILEACDVLYSDNTYGNLKLFLKNHKFSALLKHEYSMYIKLWASTVPIAGVWSSLVDLTMNKPRWVA
ncbi:jg25285, partial [Pararge aegeria aegeria]